MQRMRRRTVRRRTGGRGRLSLVRTIRARNTATCNISDGRRYDLPTTGLRHNDAKHPVVYCRGLVDDRSGS